MMDPCVTVYNRSISPFFMAGEAAWIISGDNRVKTIAPYAPSIAQFSDDGETFFGAYGPAVSRQLDSVVDSLTRDPQSRQAVINLWRENPPQTKDVPCTTNVQWILRDGVNARGMSVTELHCIDTMRSSDVWLGWPYDVFNFSMISAIVLMRLRNRGVKVSLGNLTLQAGSQHLYLRNKEKAELCVANPDWIEMRPFYPSDFNDEKDLTDYLWNVANKCSNGEHAEFMRELL
jgi:thymidylate synthase